MVDLDYRLFKKQLNNLKNLHGPFYLFGMVLAEGHAEMESWKMVRYKRS